VGLLQQWFNRLSGFDNEIPRLLGFLADVMPAPAGGLVLDVGCGRGRILRELARLGHDALGVEVNPALVAQNRAAGLQCMEPAEWERDGRLCDVIIMAHIIEHFTPSDLLAFLDGYLARLKPGGHLLIATPLMNDQFYDDFDHVKPYQPVGFMMVFGGEDAQVQYYARSRLQMRDLWFRRSPLRPSFRRGLYLRDGSRHFWWALQAGGVLAFRASGGLIGRTDGWIGVFRKVG
jgi:SAM-dependent methyltransferase